MRKTGQIQLMQKELRHKTQSQGHLATLPIYSSIKQGPKTEPGLQDRGDEMKKHTQRPSHGIQHNHMFKKYYLILSHPLIIYIYFY